MRLYPNRKELLPLFAIELPAERHADGLEAEAGGDDEPVDSLRQLLPRCQYDCERRAGGVSMPLVVLHVGWAGEGEYGAGELVGAV
jgi:hypothetical protein